MQLAVDETSTSLIQSLLSPGPKVPSRLMLENVWWFSEPPVLLLICRLISDAAADPRKGQSWSRLAFSRVHSSTVLPKA